MAEPFEINGQTYLAGKMPLMEKFHVSRRLAPVLSDMMKAGTTDNGAVSTMSAIADAVSKMPQEDADYVLSQCLAAARIKQGDRFVAIRATSGAMMFDFIDLPDMMQIVLGVLQENLGAFFPATPSTSTGEVSTLPMSSLSASPTV